jgi:hypothetical protein
MSELAVAPVRHGPFPGHLAPEVIAAYAAATGDRPRRCSLGSLYLQCSR